VAVSLQSHTLKKQIPYTSIGVLERRCFELLFVIVAEHTVENCPGGLIRPDKQFTAKLDESMKKSCVKVVEGYLDAPRHVWYFILDANDASALSNAVEPFRLVGTVRISPVMRYSEGVTRAKDIGIQK
jgi:hypothetical protein